MKATNVPETSVQRDLAPAIRAQATDFLEKAKAVVKIRTQADRTAVAVLLVTNKDLQKAVHEDLDPIVEDAHGLWKKMLALRSKHLDPLVEEEARCKKMQNIDRAEQAEVAEKRRLELQAKADEKAQEDRRKEVAALRVQEFKTMMAGFQASPDIRRLFKAAAGTAYLSMSDEMVSALAEKYEIYMSAGKADTPELRELFSFLKKGGAEPAGVAAALEEAPVVAHQVTVTNKAEAAAEAAGLTYRAVRHMEITDVSLLPRQFLVPNEQAIRAAALAFWETIKPKDAKDAQQFSAAAVKFAAWRGVPGVRFWMTKESADTGRR